MPFQSAFRDALHEMSAPMRALQQSLKCLGAPIGPSPCSGWQGLWRSLPGRTRLRPVTLFPVAESPLFAAFLVHLWDNIPWEVRIF